MGAEATTYWVLLRGLVREQGHWDDFPEQFAKTLAGAAVYPIDLPGNGIHWQQPSPLTVTEMMESVRGEVLAQLAANTGPTTPAPPVYLLAVSLGAMVAVEWAHRYPGELAGAILINTSLRGINPLPQRLRPGIWPLLARIVTVKDTAERERLIFALTSALKPPSAALLESRVAIHQRHPVRIKNVFRQLMAAAQYHAPAEKPAVPLLLINSAGDRMVHPACTESIAAKWRAERRTHPWGGHDLPLDDPAWVIEEASQWLSRLANQSRQA